MAITAPINLTFSKSKETPGTIQYKEDERPGGEPTVIGTLYLKKQFATGHDRLRVTIQPAPPTT
jgi:hypothetical protein